MDGSGVQKWRCKAIPSGRPLYGLDRLAARPNAPVLVAEGEKAADGAARRFSNHVTVAASGGASAAAMTDWTPLKGRTIVIWPDADTPGNEFAADVARILRGHSDCKVSIVQFPTGFRAAVSR